MASRRAQIDTEDGEITDTTGISQSSRTLGPESPSVVAPSLRASAGKDSYSRSRSRSHSRSYNSYTGRRTCGSHSGYSRHSDRCRSRSPRRGDSKLSRHEDKVVRTGTDEPSASMSSLAHMANSGDDAAACDEVRVDECVALYLDGGDEDAETERLLEARRRRRREILELHETQNAAQSAAAASLTTVDYGPRNPSTAGVRAQSVELVLEKHGVVDRRAANPPISPSDSLPAADYSPSADANADDVRHRIAAQVMTKTALAAEPTVQVDDNGDDDDFDMFADDDELLAKLRAAGPKGGLVATAAAASAMVDDWDDAEGYYRTNIGELLDDRYLVQAFLGQGVFSSVVKAVDTKNGDAPVAVKIIRQNELMYKAGVKEKKMLERLEAADPSGKMHVVRLLSSFVHRGHLCLCFELMSLNLREIVRKYGRDSGLSLQAVKVYAAHLFLALDLLRRCEIVHGDLKPDNCFVSEQRNNVKLGDLGSASDVSENEITPYLVSRFYRAPEVILGIPHDCAVDMWSLGVTLFELYTGKILFPGKSNNHMLRLMMEARGHFSNKMLRRGQLWSQHFEDSGGNMMDFVSRSHDRIANADISQRMVFTKPVMDIKTRIMQATPTGSTAEEIQQALKFASLLDRCLELGPDKRATPMEALRHPFFAQK
ncbi:U4/U6 small nuclear ribonucleoprotein prp4 [Coemansia sp. BCRC 34301]|nr:U4/U6 small nuclear ribonucleoprotein prp4 [Coemansia sp. BCRC 34301]